MMNEIVPGDLITGPHGFGEMADAYRVARVDDRLVEVYSVRTGRVHAWPRETVTPPFLRRIGTPYRSVTAMVDAERAFDCAMRINDPLPAACDLAPARAVVHLATTITRIVSATTELIGGRRSRLR